MFREFCSDKPESLNFQDRLDILLEIMLSSVAEQGYTMLYEEFQLKCKNKCKN